MRLIILLFLVLCLPVAAVEVSEQVMLEQADEIPVDSRDLIKGITYYQDGSQYHLDDGLFYLLSTAEDKFFKYEIPENIETYD